MSALEEAIARAIFAERYNGPYETIPWVMKAARAALKVVREADRKAAI